MKENRISSYIKQQDHEKRKTRAYTEDIGKYYNMKTQVFEDEVYYICHDGRELHHIRTETRQAGCTQPFKPQKSKKELISIRIDKSLLQQVDRLTSQNNSSRNEFIVQSISFAIENILEE